MKFDLSDTKSFDSDYFLKLAITCRHNAIVLRDSANRAFENNHSKNHAIFLLHTAFEELQKAIFCLFVHRGFMTPSQIAPIFSKHEAKIILFEKIFHSPNFYIKKGRFYLDDTLLLDLNFKKLIEDNRDFGRDYMEKRNDCLYVRPDKDGNCYTPSRTLVNADLQRTDIISKLTALYSFFDIVWTNDFEGDFENFNYYKLTPKGKSDTHHVTFTGTGILNPRKNYKPDWVDEYGKKLTSET